MLDKGVPIQACKAERLVRLEFTEAPLKNSLGDKVKRNENKPEKVTTQTALIVIMKDIFLPFQNDKSGFVQTSMAGS